MTVKLVILKSGENIISDVKELVSDDKAVAYILNKPHIVFIEKGMFYLTETKQDKLDNDKEVQIVLSDWIPLSKDDNAVIPTDWVVTVVDPLDSVKDLYLEKVNGQDNQVSIVES